MAIAAHDGADRADQLIGITERLIGLVTAETQALKAGKLGASANDWAEKEKLAHAYRLEMNQIRDNPSMLDGSSAEQRAELVTLAQSFQALLETHANALTATKDVTEGLVRAITTEVAESRAAPQGYGATGAVQRGHGAAGSGIAADLKA